MTVVAIRQPDDRQVREIPVNVEAEQGLIGSLLMNNATFPDIAPILEPHHFSEPLHQRIYDVIASLIGQQKLADFRIVKTFLGNDEVIPGFTMNQYLARLVTHAVIPLDVPQYARLIVDLWCRRQMIGISQDLADVAYDAPVAARPSQIASSALTDLQAVARVGAEDANRRQIGSSTDALIAQTQRIINKEEKLDTVTSGIADLDEATGGLWAGDLVVVAGRPGMGKTAFMAASARGIAHENIGVAAFELELAERQTTARILAETAYDPGKKMITFGDILRADLDDAQLYRLEAASCVLKALPLVIDYSPSLTVPDIAARVRSEKARMAKQGIALKVIFIDQLDYLKPVGRHNGNLNNEIGEITIALKTLAKEEGIAIVLFVQLSRAVESREDKRPTMADLRNSGNIEQNADVVIFLYRHIYYVERSQQYKDALKRSEENPNDPILTEADECKKSVEAIISKVRIGAPCTVDLFGEIGASVIRSKPKREQHRNTEQLRVDWGTS